MEIREAAVIGLGTMGAGIAEVLARGGLVVTGVEADHDALARGMQILSGSLDKAVARGKLAAQDRQAILQRVRPGTQLSHAKDADLVVEVVPEQLAIKRQVFAALDQACRPDAILATNTSSLSVTEIAAGTARPGRVVGMHFFNPAPVMRLVEVVSTVLTDTAAASAVTGLARSLGKTPVQVGDRAGFVANALLLPYLNNAVRLLETGYATREDIDGAVTAGVGLPMGPLALLDLIGLDTSLAILEVLQAEFGGTRNTPAPLLRRLVAAGRTGRKSGSGFYHYEQGRTAPAPAPETTADKEDLPPGPAAITLIGADAGPAVQPLADRIAAAGVAVSREPAQSSELTVVAVGPHGGVLSAALAAGRAADAVGLHLVSDTLAELVPTRLTEPRAVAAARALAGRLGLRSVESPDRPGLLAGALLYPHLRDAVTMIGDGYASAADIDTAMTLGCGYPKGPLRLLDEAGAEQVTSTLAAMHAAYGDPALVPPPLLAEHATAGLGFTG